jgi:flavin-binding protein dodecin
MRRTEKRLTGEAATIRPTPPSNASPGETPGKEELMAVIKTIDLVGVSTESWRDAAAQALAEAAKTLRGIESMEVLETSAVVDGDQIKEYQTHVRIRFRIER